VELRGCYPILATPFLPDGEIDENGVVRHLKI
jgi:dihydrodipicolinate synthase/N-acetylneuraminate lyase